MFFTPEEAAFRDEVQNFLNEQLTERLRRGARLSPTVFAEPDISIEWQQMLNAKGWLGYCWPKGYGGTGWGPIKRYIFEKECALAHAPELPILSLKLLGSVLHQFGSVAQKAHYLPRILLCEDYWCQGFSEPASGSDLANLKTSAVRDGDNWIVNGSKLWTTHAHFADHIFCLVRTNPEVKAQAGISFLLIDMRQVGIEVRPIVSISGDHEVNAVFLDNVVVPVENMVGEEGQGWSIAKFLLEKERGGSCHAPVILAELSELRVQASHAPNGHGSALIENAEFRKALSRAEFEVQALETTELRILADIAQGKPAGPQTSLVKLIASNLRQQVRRLAMSLYGYAGLQLTYDRPLYGVNAPDPVLCEDAQVASANYLNALAWTIFGGSNEIQRAIIAKTVLNL